MVMSVLFDVDKIAREQENQASCVAAPSRKFQ